MQGHNPSAASNPNLSSLLHKNPTMPALPLSDVEAWRDMIARKEINQFRPEEILAVYDSRSPSSDKRLVLTIERYLLLLIDGMLDEKLGFDDARIDVSESKHRARKQIHEALLIPDSGPGRALRKYFGLTIHRKCLDARRAQFNYRRRHQNFEAFDDMCDEPGHTDEPVHSQEDKFINAIDIKNLTRAEANASRRVALEMTLRGYSQEEISVATGVSVRQVRRWLKSFATKKPV